MSSNYAWIGDALAWIAPVALGVNSFYVYPNKILAFNGQAVAEYDAPFALGTEPFGLPFNAARTINWSKVTNVSLGKACDVSISGGKVKLPIIEHFFDPEPINVDGVSYPANEIVSAVRSVISAADKSAIGWHNCVHFDGDAVIAVPQSTSVLYYVVLPYELERIADLTLNSAKMVIGIPLSNDAEAIFGGAHEDETAYRSLTIVSGPGRFMTVLASLAKVNVLNLVKRFGDEIRFHMDIDPSLADVFKTLKSLGEDNVYADMDFREDGLFVSGVGVDAIQVPVQYSSDGSPSAITRLQIALVEINREPLRCGFSSTERPLALFFDDKTVFVMPMKRSV